MTNGKRLRRWMACSGLVALGAACLSWGWANEAAAQVAQAPDCSSRAQARVYQSASAQGERLGETYWTSLFGRDCQRFESYVETVASFPLSSNGCFGQGFLDGMSLAVDEVESQCFDACFDTGASAGFSLGLEFCGFALLLKAQSAPPLCTVFSLTGCQSAFDSFVAENCEDRSQDPEFAEKLEELRARCELQGPVISRRSLAEEDAAIKQLRAINPAALER